MNTRKERLNEVYQYLRQHHGIHTKTEFADAIQVKRPGLYSAMNGNEAYLTDSLFNKICAAFQGLFNLDYLLTGLKATASPMMTISNKPKTNNL